MEIQMELITDMNVFKLPFNLMYYWIRLYLNKNTSTQNQTHGFQLIAKHSYNDVHSNVFTNSTSLVICCAYPCMNGTSKWCSVVCKCATSYIQDWATLNHPHMHKISRIFVCDRIDFHNSLLHLPQSEIVIAPSIFQSD